MIHFVVHTLPPGEKWIKRHDNNLSVNIKELTDGIHLPISPAHSKDENTDFCMPTKPTHDEILKGIMGQGGALVLACIILYNIMAQYEKLIDTMVTDNKEDRAMYQSNMSELSNHMDKVNDTLVQIQEDISTIRAHQTK